MFDRGVVDAEDALVVQRADDHRHRIAVEQQAERSLALLQLGDVDAQADHAAVAGQPLLDQDDAAVGQRLLMALAGLMEPFQPLGDPFFLAADRFRIFAARDADADACPAALRPARTGRRCGCRSRRISCSRGCSGLRHRGTRCPAAGCRSPRAGAHGICARRQSRLRLRRACARSRRSRLRPCRLLVARVSRWVLPAGPGCARSPRALPCLVFFGRNFGIATPHTPAFCASPVLPICV